MNSPSDRSPQPPNDEHEQRITALEDHVKSQQQEFVFLKQHIDNSLVQLELRIRNEIIVAMHGAEQRFNDRFDAVQRRQDEHFRWLFGMLVVVFISNSAAILTMMNLVLNR